MNNTAAQYTEEDEIDLRELFNTILRRKKLIIIMTTLITLLAGIYAFMKTPIYEVKSNIKLGFIGDKLIGDPASLVKTLNVVYNVEDTIDAKEGFTAKVSSISSNKKISNFIQIVTEGISNKKALELNKEILLAINEKYAKRIEQYKKNNIAAINEVQTKIDKVNTLEKKNIERKIKILEAQTLPLINGKIAFLKNDKLPTIKEKIKFNYQNLKKYEKEIKKLYSNSKKTKDSATLVIISIQMGNYQNLILNSQNNIQNLKLERETIKKKTLPTLQGQKKNLVDDTLRKLKYDLEVTLKNNKLRLEEKIVDLKYKNSDQNIKNSIVVGKYVMHNYASKPKKKLIIVVAFITGLILSIFLVFFLEFLASTREEETKQ